MRSTLPICFFMLSMVAGCGRSDTTFNSIGKKVGFPGGGPEMKKADGPRNEMAGKNEELVGLQEPGAPQGGKNLPDQKDKAEKQRKIRYTSDQSIIVEDFDKAWENLKIAMKEVQAELAQEEIHSSPGAPRFGTWRIRVPVDRMQAFRTKVNSLGEAERNTLQSEDLTAQYYDLEAHITNRNAEREALRDLLKEVGKKDIKHYLEIKRELDSLSDDINRKEGQLRLWKSLTDLTTCTVNLREKQKYIPEEKAKDKEDPTFGMRAGKTWSDSGETFVAFCQGLVLVGIALTPWLPIPLVVLSLVWLISRRAARKRLEPPAVMEVVEPSPEKKS
jgi:hypothetical protein